MAKLSEYRKVATQKVLVNGMSGAGKSTLVAQLAEHYTLHWLDLENGVNTLLKLPLTWQDNIDIISIPDSAAFPIASATLSTLFKNGKASICAAHGKDTCMLCKKDSLPVTELDFSLLTTNDIVVIDTATQLSHSILSHLTRAQAVDYKLERDDWGGLRRMTEFFCSQFQAATFNLVVICHVVEAKTEDGKTKLVPSFGSAGMSAEFAKAFDHVVYCEVKNGKHVAGSSTTYSGSIMTKSRTDFCIEKLPVPSLLPIFQLAPPPQPSQNSVATSALNNLKKELIK